MKKKIQIINKNKTNNKWKKKGSNITWKKFLKYHCDLISNFLHKQDMSLNDLEEMICKETNLKNI
jgi:hypothetical protein